MLGVDAKAAGCSRALGIDLQCCCLGAVQWNSLASVSAVDGEFL